MTEAARKRATYEDVLRAPDDVIAEVVDGVLETSPRPVVRHSVAATILSGELMPPFLHARGGGPGGWVILYEPELHLGDDILVPDLAGWRRERLRGDELEAAYFTLAPDWICEVLSPSTAGLDRIRKMPVYARERVQFAWLIDPAAQSLEVYRLADGKWLQLSVHEGDARVRAEPFDAFALELGLLWRL